MPPKKKLNKHYKKKHGGGDDDVVFDISEKKPQSTDDMIVEDFDQVESNPTPTPTPKFTTSTRQSSEGTYGPVPSRWEVQNTDAYKGSIASQEPLSFDTTLPNQVPEKGGAPTKIHIGKKAYTIYVKMNGEFVTVKQAMAAIAKKAKKPKKK